MKHRCKIERNDGMRFDREGETSEGLGAGPAIALAMMERLGIRQTIDEECEWSNQRNLSPGNCAKAVIGTMCTESNKTAMRNIAGFYSGSPTELLFGDRVDLKALNDSALGRGLETIHKAGTEKLFYTIASRVKAEIGCDSVVFNVDPSNITICRSPGEEYEELPEGAPRPMLGHPKDNSTDRVQYNFCASTDGDGLPVYMKAYDGNKDDTMMISEAVRYIERMMGDRRIVAVGDSKMVTKELVSHMVEVETLFVSKSPKTFSKDVASDVAAEALIEGFSNIGRIGSRKLSPEIELYETERECYGMRLRFVAYRRVDRSNQVRHMKRVIGIRVGEVARSLESASYASEDEARSARDEAASCFSDTAWSLNTTIRSRRKGDSTEWKVSCKPTFDESRARVIAGRKVEVVITNIAPSGFPKGDPTAGATAREVLEIYFGQWRVEGLFSEMKSGLGADTVFFQNPDRESAMLFLLAVAALVRAAIKLLLRRQCGRGHGIPKDITSRRVFLLLRNVDLTLDRASDRMYFEGSETDRAFALSVVDALELDPASLLG